MWDLHIGVTWTQFSFYYVLVGPVFHYVAATILMPRQGELPASWEIHLSEIRRPLLSIMFFYIVWGIALTWWLRDLSLFHPYRAIQVLFIGLFIIGLLTRHVKYHAALPFLQIGMLFVSQIYFRLLPDAFGTALWHRVVPIKVLAPIALTPVISSSPMRSNSTGSVPGVRDSSIR